MWLAKLTQLKKMTVIVNGNRSIKGLGEY